MISGSSWSTFLFASLQSKGFVGSRLMDFTDAVGNGGQSHVVGKAFTTTDTGTIPGTGSGTGTGITGLIAATISSLIFAASSAIFGQFGSRLMDVTDSVGDAAVAELALALLTSTHSPVFAGSGVVDIGSIPVVAAAWGSAIQAAAPSFLGGQWPNFAQALGEQATHVLANGTGSVTITGSPTGAPVPGVGTGSGTIS